MVDEAFRIVLDPVFPPHESYYHSEEFLNTEPLFELIYNEGSVSNLDYLLTDSLTVN